MRGVKFGDYHTYEDWKLILNAKNISPPSPKIVKVQVDGRDGDINLSRTLTGEMKYENREASFTFLVTEGSQEEREELINSIVNLLHGNELKIIEPDDLDHYLIGEIVVTKTTNDKAYGTIEISADLEPYRYSISEVNRTITASETKVDVVLNNTGRKTVTPTLTVDGVVNLEFGSSSASLETGTYKLSNLNLRSGATVVTISGTGSVVFTYREAVI